MRLAHDEGLLEERLFVLNGDVLTDIDLTAELEQHERRGARATLALYAVEDTSSYGVVPTDDDGAVEAFIEKGDGEPPTNRINAGAYVIERDVVETSIPAGRAVSFEREVFPALVGDGLYGYDAAGYWIDIGTPERYLEATWDLLAGRVASTLPPRDETGSLVYEDCLLSGAHVGPQSVLGRHCSVGTDARVERRCSTTACTWEPTRRSWSRCSAERVRVGERAQVGPGAMVGAGAVIPPDAVVGRRRARGAGGDALPLLDRDSIERVDPGGMLGRRAGAAAPARRRAVAHAVGRHPPAGHPGGMVVCGMGGSAIGGDLAKAALGDRATRPITSCAGTRSSRGRRPSRSSCARATRATPRRRSPASRRPARPARSGPCSPPAASWPSWRARRACR